MITCDYGGGFGNRLFQYVFARLLSDKLKLKLKSLPGKEIDEVLPTTNQPEYITYEAIKHTIDDNYTYDNILKRDYEKCGYHLKGYFQRAEYYLDNRDQVLSYFNFKSPTELNKKDIVCHIRLGDYKQFGYKGNVLHPNYYIDILKKEKYEKLYIVTDEPGFKEYFDYFKDINYEIVSLSENHERDTLKTKKDFEFIMGFDRIIIGNSTFSWWAAFISNASKVYTPAMWIRHCSDMLINLHIIKNGVPVKNKFYDIKSYKKYKKYSFIICLNESRKDMLKDCIDNINEIYKNDEKEIIIVEQEGIENFKRGQLFNLGYKESSGDIVIMQDVDIRYMHKIDFNYRMQLSNSPILPFTHVSQLVKTNNGYVVTKTDRRPNGFGAVNVFAREQFEKCNGFSNLYIGWGSEDTEMMHRAKFERLSCCLGHIEHSKSVIKSKRNSVLIGTSTQRDIFKDGLEQTIYEKKEVIKNENNIYHYKFSDIGVTPLFEYKSLFELDENKFISNVRRQLNTHIPIGILTYNRPSYFSSTLNSLQETLSIDKKKFYIFDDGSDSEEKITILNHLKKEVNVVSFIRSHKVFKATKMAIEHLYVNNPKDKYYGLFQDDIRFSKEWYYNTLSIIDIMNKDGLDWGLLSIYNLRTPSIRPYVKIESGHSGAPALIINRDFWIEYRKDNSINEGRECNLADFLLAHWCQTNSFRQFAVCVTGRSLVQHIGIKSSLSDRDMSDTVTPLFTED